MWELWTTKDTTGFIVFDQRWFFIHLLNILLENSTIRYLSLTLWFQLLHAVLSAARHGDFRLHLLTIVSLLSIRFKLNEMRMNAHCMTILYLAKTVPSITHVMHNRVGCKTFWLTEPPFWPWVAAPTTDPSHARKTIQCEVTNETVWQQLQAQCTVVTMQSIDSYMTALPPSYHCASIYAWPHG